MAPPIEYQPTKPAPKQLVAARFSRELEFPLRGSVKQLEEGSVLMPKFQDDGLMPCIAQDARSGEEAWKCFADPFPPWRIKEAAEDDEDAIEESTLQE